VALIETITDGFASNAGGLWATYGTVVFDGQLKITATSSGVYRANAATGEVEDLTGSSCAIEWVQAAGTSVLFYLSDGSGSAWIGFYYDGATLQAREKHSGVETALGTAVTYNATNHRWLRFREAAGTTYWETSPTGLTGSWTTLHSMATTSVPFAVTALQPSVFAGGSGGTAIFDNLNLLPTGGTPPSNTALPVVSGTPGAGNPLTGTLGTWSGSPTSWTGEWRFVRDDYDNQYLTHGIYTYVTIPGSSFTTTNPAFTPTHTQSKSEASRAVYLHVTASNAGGSTSADSLTKIFYADAPPFKAVGSPFKSPLPSGVPIDSALTTALRAQIDSWYAGGSIWWAQGGDYGDSDAPFLHIVDSSMARVPWKLFSNYNLIGQPPIAPVQNGTMLQHLAWTFGVKNGGIPMPSFGYDVPHSTDHPVCIYCEDTHEYWEIWLAYHNPVAADWPGVWDGQTQHASYAGQWVGAWGGYMRDVRENPGYWFGSAGQDAGGNFYRLDADGNREFARFGTAATSLAQMATGITQKEMHAGVIDHAIGIIFPGSNGTHLWPAQRHDSGSGGSLPQGGIWRLDPSINVAALPSLGHAGADAFRAMVFAACQTYGMIPCDSSNSGFAIRMESMGGTFPDYPGAFQTGIAGFAVTFDTIMKSVPTSSWSFVSPAYRPTGAITGPSIAALTNDFEGAWDDDVWGRGGSPLPAASSGRLRMSAPTTGVVVYPIEGYIRSLLGATCHVEFVQGAGNVYCLYYLHPNDSSLGMAFNFNPTTGNLECIYQDAVGATIGTMTTVPYSPTAHRWLRFREAAGTVYWETSAGGDGPPSSWVWISRRSAASAWSVDGVSVSFYVQGTDTGVAVFDNLNLGGTGVVDPGDGDSGSDATRFAFDTLERLAPVNR
jgi:hypothetical protein